MTKIVAMLAVALLVLVGAYTGEAIPGALETEGAK